MVAIVLDRGDDCFHRFLAELLGAMFRTPIQQSAGVGRLSLRRGACVDDGGKIMDRKARHQLYSRVRPRIGAPHAIGFSTSVARSRQGSSRIGSPARTI